MFFYLTFFGFASPVQVSAEAFLRVSAWGQPQWVRFTAGIPGREAAEEQEVWQAVAPLIRGNGRLFEQDLGALAGLQRILQARGLLRQDLELAEIFTNRFVPE